MRLDNYLLYYFHFLMFICFFFNFWLFLVLIIVWIPYFLNIDSDTPYEFDFHNSSFDAVENQYLEYDIDDEFTYILYNEEFYLIWNCRFYFDTFGGMQLLDFLDYMDLDFYNNINMKNFKYIYESFNFIKNENNINEDSDQFLYTYSNDFHYSFFFKDFNDEIFNFIKNIRNIENLQLKKRLNIIRNYNIYKVK